MLVSEAHATLTTHSAICTHSITTTNACVILPRSSNKVHPRSPTPGPSMPSAAEVKSLFRAYLRLGRTFPNYNIRQ